MRVTKSTETIKILMAAHRQISRTGVDIPGTAGV